MTRAKKKKISPSLSHSPLEITFAVERGYESLAVVLVEALNQAQFGKGKLRHGETSTPFSEQPMFKIMCEVGAGFAAGQYAKKLTEAMRLDPGPRRAEILGAIVYAACMLIFCEDRHKLLD